MESVNEAVRAMRPASGSNMTTNPEHATAWALIAIAESLEQIAKVLARGTIVIQEKKPYDPIGD